MFLSPKIVFVLDESDVESIYSADFSTKPTSINANRRSSHLLQSFVDFEQQRQQLAGRKSTIVATRSRGSQFSLNSSYTGSIDEQLGTLTANLNLDDQHELKAQLLKRCNQADVLPFDDVYSDA